MRGKQAIRPLPALATFLLLAPAALFALPVLIAEGGVSRAAIVYPREPSARLAQAVAELQDHVRRMSGAAVELVEEPQDGLNSLHLRVEEHGDPLPDPGALAALNAEGFILRTGAGEAWLCGRSELGLQHAVYWLLEQWGCRWLFPGEAGEVVPASPTLVVDRTMETDQQPHFLMRDIWYNYASYLPESVHRDRLAWKRRNRLDYSFRGSIGHAYDRFVPRDDDELFASHPEYFPRVFGRPVRCGQICTANADVRARAVEYAFDYFRRNPDSRMVSLSPNDGPGPWRCPENRQYRFFTDAALDLANHVADALAANPATGDKLVAMYAYLDTSRPASFPARDNVIIFFATRLGTAPWRWRIGAWAENSRHLGIQDYASILPWHWTRPAWRLERLQRNVHTWREHGVKAVNVESGNDWGGWGLYHYVMGRLLWDPDADVDAVVADFLDKGFGPAAEPMGRYFRRWRFGHAENLLQAAARDLAAALQAADCPSVRTRIEQYALYVHHLKLLAAYRAARERPERVRALRELVAFGWRIAPTNMAHTAPLTDHYLRKDARRLALPVEELEGWKRSDAVGSAEIRRLLRTDAR